MKISLIRPPKNVLTVAEIEPGILYEFATDLKDSILCYIKTDDHKFIIRIWKRMDGESGIHEIGTYPVNQFFNKNAIMKVCAPGTRLTITT